MSELKDLIDIIEKEESEQEPIVKTNEPRINRDVRRFIRRTELARGNNKVPTYVIYYHFIKWGKKYWIKLGKEEFFRTFKQFFEQKRSGNQRFYLINDALDLSDEIYEKAKKYDIKWQKRKNSKK